MNSQKFAKRLENFLRKVSIIVAKRKSEKIDLKKFKKQRKLQNQYREKDECTDARYFLLVKAQFQDGQTGKCSYIQYIWSCIPYVLQFCMNPILCLFCPILVP